MARSMYRHKLPDRRRKPDKLQTVTVREFDGGWNAIDNDLNLDPRFAKVLSNMHRSKNGGINVRQGTRQFADLANLLGSSAIVNIAYFNKHIISVGENGKVTKTNGTGTSAIVFDDTMAASLGPATRGWSETSFVSFAHHTGNLVLCNGVNKPLRINSSMVCSYVIDPPSGANTNTPICRYVLVIGRYTLMAGDPTAPSTLYISNLDTFTTWPGDIAPNDAITINLGSRVNQGSDAIKGLGVFRDQPIVFFEEGLLIGTLGIYTNAGAHAPLFEDWIPNNGAISHRVIQFLGDDTLFCDPAGVSSVRRAAVVNKLRPARVSELIDPEIQKQIDKIGTDVGLEDNTYSVYHLKEGDYMLFVPNHEDLSLATEARVFAYKLIDTLKINAWAEYRKWPFRAACRSSLNRVFFAHLTEPMLFVLGDDNDPTYVDLAGYMEMWDDDTPFTDYTGFSPTSDADEGIAIPFAWELPWADLGSRGRTKRSRFISFDTKGTARFKVQMFVDNVYEDRSDPGEDWLDGFLFDDNYGWARDEPILAPDLEQEFVCADALGFGGAGYGADGYGGGRPSGDTRLYDWSTRFKIAKVRISGDAIGPGEFVSMTLHYRQGGAR